MGIEIKGQIKNNDIVTNEIIEHLYYKLYHGYRNTKPLIWFKNIFLNELRDMIPFLFIYPVEIKNNEIDRRIALGNGLNSEDLQSFYQDGNLEIQKKFDSKKYEVDKTKNDTVKVLFIHQLKENEKLKLYIITIEYKISDDKYKYYELGFLKEESINYLMNQKFTMEIFLTLIRDTIRVLNMIINDK